MPPIPNHLTGAIMATIFCCQILGIVAIIYASNVNSKIAAGDFAGAQAASDKAEFWMWLAFACGLISTLFFGAMCIR
jgi:hypothetical protein